MEFRHPKYYKELRKRNKSDQAISTSDSTECSDKRAPGPGLKLQAREDSTANSTRGRVEEPQASSDKPQATSCSKDSNLPSQEETQAASDKHQA